MIPLAIVEIRELERNNPKSRFKMAGSDKTGLHFQIMAFVLLADCSFSRGGITYGRGKQVLGKRSGLCFRVSGIHGNTTRGLWWDAKTSDRNCKDSSGKVLALAATMH